MTGCVLVGGVDPPCAVVVLREGATEEPEEPSIGVGSDETTTGVTGCMLVGEWTPCTGGDLLSLSLSLTLSLCPSTPSFFKGSHGHSNKTIPS